jgi:uncharacterized protein YjbI with pentapeptide repeats
LKWAQLQGADLWQAQLQGADLRKAGIGGAEFKNANLDFTNLRDLGRTPLTKEGSAGADFNQDCGYHSVSSFRGLSFPATMRR